MNNEEILNLYRNFLEYNALLILKGKTRILHGCGIININVDHCGGSFYNNLKKYGIFK